MAAVDIWLGSTKAERVALERLRRRADEVFQIQSDEETNLRTHVHADVSRLGLLRDRFDLDRAQANRKSDRNWYTLLALGAAMILKGSISLAALGAAVKWFASL